jgi:predicted nucleotidyltransferase
MDRDQIITRLREKESELRALGVAHTALFGSRARGDESDDSDTDIMIDINPESLMSVYEYVGVRDFIANLFEGRVDVVNRAGFKPYIRPSATSDVIYAF